VPGNLEDYETCKYASLGTVSVLDVPKIVEHLIYLVYSKQRFQYFGAFTSTGITMSTHTCHFTHVFLPPDTNFPKITGVSLYSFFLSYKAMLAERNLTRTYLS